MPHLFRAIVLIACLIITACNNNPTREPSSILPKLQPKLLPKIALVLGGGAARGFSHVGIIKALEAQGIIPDMVVGTSAGAVVGVLYAAGITGFDLQKIALQLDESVVADWAFPDRGIIKGEALENFINKTLNNRPIERLPKSFAAVATDLQTGEGVVFRIGNAGKAVLASSSVPGIFQPVVINGHEYVDGGLVAPVPVRIARSLGADFVIAVDVSAQPKFGKTQSTVEILLQTFTIMAQSISRFELREADIIIRPFMREIKSTDFAGKHLAILEGERAVAAILPDLRAKLARLKTPDSNKITK